MRFQKYLPSVLVGLSLFLMEGSLWAKAETRCFPKGCLTEGWDDVVWNPGPVLVGRATCVQEDCSKNGWNYEAYGSPFRSQIVCDPQGCFQSGWVEKNAKSGQILRRIQCDTGGCLVKGWTAYFYVEQPPYVNVQCEKNDCAHFGWRIRYPNGAWRNVRCVKDDCFVNGWTSNP